MKHLILPMVVIAVGAALADDGKDYRFCGMEGKTLRLVESRPRTVRPVVALPVEEAPLEVRTLTMDGELDECLYIFDDEEEEYKVGLFARYGERSYGAYFPCGCACEQLSGYFDHIKELHKPTVFFESEKEKWLEKVRPIAKNLYVPDDDEDDE